MFTHQFVAGASLPNGCSAAPEQGRLLAISATILPFKIRKID
jgi:hypothetical protein